MSELIKFATSDDLEKLLDWRMEVLAHVFEGEDLSGLRHANEDYYRNHLNSDHYACFLDVDGQTIGCGGICLQEEMPSPDNPTGKCAWIMNIYVREPWRHHGYGKKIVNALIARANCPGKVWLEASRLGEPLYETMGFEKLEDIMEMKR